MPCELPKEISRIIGRYAGCVRSSDEYSEECLRPLRAGLKTSGAQRVGSGVHRTGFAFRDKKGNRCVVKVATGRYSGIDGRDANLSEAGMYRDLSKSQKRFFLPVWHADERGWWLTGPQVDVGVEDEDMDLLEEKTGCSDLHGANVGYYKGRPIVLDSGFEESGCPSGLPRPRSPSFPRRPLPLYALRRARFIGRP